MVDRVFDSNLGERVMTRVTTAVRLRQKLVSLVLALPMIPDGCQGSKAKEDVEEEEKGEAIESLLSKL